MKLFTYVFGLLALSLTVTTALPTEIDRRGGSKAPAPKAPAPAPQVHVPKVPVPKVPVPKAPAPKVPTPGTPAPKGKGGAKAPACSRKRGECENLNIVVYDPWSKGQRYHWALFLTKKDSVAGNTQGTIYQLKYDKESKCLVPQKIEGAQPNKWPRALLTAKTKLLGSVDKETADLVFEEKKYTLASDGIRCQEWTQQMAEAMLGYTPDSWPESVPA